MEWELELGCGLHVHHKRRHVHDHKRVLRTCEVGSRRAGVGDTTSDSD